MPQAAYQAEPYGAPSPRPAAPALKAIIGFSEIISSEMCGPISPQYREYGEIIRTSGHRLLRLVNQTLEIAKLEGGALELEPSAELLDLGFADAERACSEELSARNIRVEVDLPDTVPAALADAKAVRNAVINLLQNAAVYAPEGSVVRLSGRAVGPLVQLSVSDRAGGAGRGGPGGGRRGGAGGGRGGGEAAPGRGRGASGARRGAGGTGPGGF